MTYTEKLTALNKGLTPIFPEQDRINFAPKLAGDIRVLLPTDDGSEKYLTLNHVYSENDSTDLTIYIPELAGTIWTVSDIDGWWNLSEPEMPDIQRGFGDGSFDITGRILARNLTLTGSILITEDSRTGIAAASTAARTALINAFNLVKRGTWLVVDEDEYKRAAFVRLSGRPEIVTTNSKGRIDFSIGLKAANPTKYEWFPTSDEGVVPEGFVGDGNAFRFIRTTGGTAGSRNYDLSGTISGVRAHTGTVAATYATNEIILTISSGTSLIGYSSANPQYVYVSGLTYPSATGSTTGPFQINSGTTVGGTTIKYTAPTGTNANPTGTALVTLQEQTSSYRTYPTLGNLGDPDLSTTRAYDGAAATVAATYATNVVTLTITNGRSLVNDGDYVYVTGLTYASASGSTTDPFLVNNSTTIGGTTIKYTAPTGTTDVSGTPVVKIAEETSYYRTYPNILYANSSSGRLSVTNYGDTNVPCYIRFVGPLFGPAIIRNTTTNQEINILRPIASGGQVLYPSDTILTVQFLGIDTRTHEVHIGDYYNGITTTNVRGLLSPLVDWIYLAPGLNDIYYEDSGAETAAGNIEIYWQSGWDG